MNFIKSWEINPIIIKEIRSRMRGPRPFLVLTGILVLLSVIGYGIYRLSLSAYRYTYAPISPLIGQMLFAGLVFFLLMVIAAITPAITSAEISGEHEKQTYEMLFTTPLSPASILWGKLVASMSYVFMVIFVAFPMSSLVFVYGGVSIRDMLKALVVLVVTALLFGVIGLFFSSFLHQSARATIASYLTVALLLFGPLLVATVNGVITQSNPPRWIATPSPIMVLASTLSNSVNSSSLSGAFWMLSSPIQWIFGYQEISQVSIPRPIYHVGLPLYGLITIVLYFVSTRLVRPIRRFRIHWSEALLMLVLIFGYLGILSLGYLATTNRYENIRIQSIPTPMPVPVIAPAGLLIEPALPLGSSGSDLEDQHLAVDPALPEPPSSAR